MRSDAFISHESAFVEMCQFLKIEEMHFRIEYNKAFRIQHIKKHFLKGSFFFLNQMFHWLF